jgi:hypothetical protein
MASCDNVLQIFEEIDSAMLWFDGSGYSKTQCEETILSSGSLRIYDGSVRRYNTVECLTQDILWLSAKIQYRRVAPSGYAMTQCDETILSSGSLRICDDSERWYNTSSGSLRICDGSVRRYNTVEWLTQDMRWLSAKIQYRGVAHSTVALWIE